MRHYPPVPAQLSGWEVLLEVGDVVHRPLPKRSVVRVGKLFTMHRRLITTYFGTTEEHKLEEVLEKLRALFVARFTRPKQSSLTLEDAAAQKKPFGPRRSTRRFWSCSI